MKLSDLYLIFILFIIMPLNIFFILSGQVTIGILLSAVQVPYLVNQFRIRVLRSPSLFS